VETSFQHRVEVAAALAAVAAGSAATLLLWHPPRPVAAGRSQFVVRDAGALPVDAPATGPAAAAGEPVSFDARLAALQTARAEPTFAERLAALAATRAVPAAPIPALAPRLPAAPSAPTQLAIPALGVRAPIEAVGVTAGGQLQLPRDGRTVVWYRFGASPGDDGSAVLAAHVDYGARPGVFFNLRRLGPGDRVAVRMAAGATRRFVVVARRLYAKPALDAGMLFRSGGRPVLTLVTCGGRFDYKTRHYAANVVVYAVPA